MNEKEIIAEYVKIGDKEFLKSDVSASTYFEYVKGMKKNIKDENLNVVIDNCLTLFNKAVLTGQEAMAERLFEKYSLMMRELEASKYGFDIVVYKSDIEKYIKNVSHHTVKIIELSKYKREIDDSVIEKLLIAKENKLFDQYYVVFTDYTDEESKKVAKERREKDPILFGTFLSSDSYKIPEERFFYIGDWIDEYCELTLDEMVKEYNANVTDSELTHKIEMPKSLDDVREYFKTIEKPEKD